MTLVKRIFRPVIGAGEDVDGLFLALRALEERRLGLGVVGGFVFRADGQQFHLAPGRPRDLEVIPGLVGHDEGDRLAGLHVTIPVGQLEVIVAAGQTRAVVDARPRRLADAVARLPPPALEVVGVVDLDLAHGDRGTRVVRRRIAGPVPAVAPPPFVAPAGIRQVAGGQRGQAGDRLAPGQRGYAAVVEHAVVDADFVDVAAADEIVVTLDIVRADDARVRSELVERGVVDGDRLVLRGELAVRCRNGCPGSRPTRSPDASTHSGRGNGCNGTDTRVRARLASVTNASNPWPL